MARACGPPNPLEFVLVCQIFPLAFGPAYYLLLDCVPSQMPPSLSPPFPYPSIFKMSLPLHMVGSPRNRAQHETVLPQDTIPNAFTSQVLKSS